MDGVSDVSHKTISVVKELNGPVMDDRSGADEVETRKETGLRRKGQSKKKKSNLYIEKIRISSIKGLYTRRGHGTAIIPCVPSKLQIHSKNSNIISILSIGIVQSIQLRLL